jgi:hypothetical protein
MNRTNGAAGPMIEVQQSATFTRWLRRLRDARARACIVARIDRMSALQADMIACGALPRRADVDALPIAIAAIEGRGRYAGLAETTINASGGDGLQRIVLGQRRERKRPVRPSCQCAVD